MTILHKIRDAFGHRDKHREHIDLERSMIEHQSQKETDKTLKDSFPASDPPGNY